MFILYVTSLTLTKVDTWLFWFVEVIFAFAFVLEKHVKQSMALCYTVAIPLLKSLGDNRFALCTQMSEVCANGEGANELTSDFGNFMFSYCPLVSVGHGRCVQQ